MATNGARRTKARALLVGLAALCGAPASGSAATTTLHDTPILWHEDDRRDIAEPREREPDLLRDQLHTALVTPVRRATRPSNILRDLGGERWRPAADVNVLGEVLESTWFTNRIGLFPMTPEEAASGPGNGRGPDPRGPWTVVGAKTEGVTPGFTIEDVRGARYLLKFDPPGFLGFTTAPAVISGRIFHAIGFNVPDDAVVRFSRERLIVASSATVKEDGKKRSMSEADVDAILSRLDKLPNGEHLGIASRFLSGRPLGPFDYEGRRKDDPNDRVRHEDRRSLRGLRVFSSWLNHFDTKQHNTLDMFIDEDGRHFVRHHLIDFASTLGSGASGPAKTHGREYGFDAPQTFLRLLSLGLVEDGWRRDERPRGLPEVGYFQVEGYDPLAFEPQQPNTAFAHMTARDGYWAAKIVSAFTDDHLRAICRAAGYQDPRAAEYVAKTLAGRRDVIAREFFTRVSPIDFFRVIDGHLTATDLGVARGVWKTTDTRYRGRSRAVDAARQGATDRRGEWQVLPALEVPLPLASSEYPFLEFEFQADRGSGWGPLVRCYVAPTHDRVIAVER